MIEVLKQALDALEFFNETAICSADTDISNDAITSLRQAIAELESQEPVAHRDGYWCADLTCKKCYSADFRLKHTIHPPQRTWQGLTTDEIAVLHANYPNPQGFALVLQAKLKQKNGFAEEKNT